MGDRTSSVRGMNSTIRRLDSLTRDAVPTAREAGTKIYTDSVLGKGGVYVHPYDPHHEKPPHSPTTPQRLSLSVPSTLGI